MRHPDFASSNRRALLLMILGLVLVLILMSLPLYRFNISVYTKKSPNTFVGDEKYVAARAEVEETAAKYREQGFDVEIGEDNDVLVCIAGEDGDSELVVHFREQELEQYNFSRKDKKALAANEG